MHQTVVRTSSDDDGTSIKDFFLVGCCSTSATFGRV